MVALRLLKTGLLAALALALLAPAASAHTAVFSADGKVRGSVGLLNEPTVTYQQTGLDACFTENNTARTPLTVDLGALTATLKAPNGQTHSTALKNQFGRAGCVTFLDAFVPTLPGQYTVDITGTINGSAIAVTGVAAGGPVTDQGNVTFPAVNVPDLLALQASNTALQSALSNLTLQVADLSGQVDALRLHPSKDAKASSPGAPAALILVGLAALAAVVRRSK